MIPARSKNTCLYGKITSLLMLYVCETVKPPHRSVNHSCQSSFLIINFREINITSIRHHFLCFYCICVRGERSHNTVNRSFPREWFLHLLLLFPLKLEIRNEIDETNTSYTIYIVSKMSFLRRFCSLMYLTWNSFILPCSAMSVGNALSTSAAHVTWSFI